VRNEFRQVERLRGMKCFPGGETPTTGLCSVLSLLRFEFDPFRGCAVCWTAPPRPWPLARDFHPRGRGQYSSDSIPGSLQPTNTL